MSKSDIEWTGQVWNPTVGCSVKSAGCRECYAMKLAYRIERMGGPAALKYQGTTEKVNGNAVWTGLVRLDPGALDIPLTWRTPQLVFVNSMSDLFHEALSITEIDAVFAVMALAADHTFQLLTKRPEIMRDYLNSPETRARIELRAGMIRPGFRIQTWPLPHVWCGTSIEDQVWADKRLPILLETNAAVRFVSLEPLLGPVVLCNAAKAAALRPDGKSGLHWAIVGGESGPDARPMHPDWARSLRDEANSLGIAFFFKQLGQWSEHNIGGTRRRVGVMLDGTEVPVGTADSVTLWNVGKKNAGRLLDGRTWDDFPAGYRPEALKRLGSTKHARMGGDAQQYPLQLDGVSPTVPSIEEGNHEGAQVPHGRRAPMIAARESRDPATRGE